MFVSKKPLIQSIGCVNWPDKYPEKPDVEFEISCSGNEILLKFSVCEPVTRAVCSNDGENVWEDSCVEFFFAPSDDGLYYNFECSCIGKLYMCCGRERNGRVFLPDEAYSLVRRRSSLGSKPFGLRAVSSWEVELAVPVEVLVFHKLSSFSGLHARGNFYKCGNLLPRRQYLSWSPVVAPAPDFHRPECFGKMDFDIF